MMTRRLVSVVLAAVVATTAVTVALVSAAEGPVVVALDGSTSAGDLAGLELDDAVVGMAATTTGNGYWLVASDGGIFAFGDANFFGSTGGIDLDQPIVGMAATPTGAGYWLVASDGGIFAYGDARFFGSMGGIALNRPVVGMASTPTGAGYWMVASDGGIFSFGDAEFFGSTGAIALDEPITAMASSTSGSGYWLLARDGGVFTFGDAEFHGSAVNNQRSQDALAIGADATGGYWVLSGDGRIDDFGPVTRDPSPDAICQSEVVRGGVIAAAGAWLYTTSLEIPRVGYNSTATGVDGASIAEELSYLQACQTVGSLSDKSFAAPLSAAVSSRYGIRIHPIWGISILHAGTDLAAPIGTTIRASADGVVVSITERSAYGLMMMIDHGDRISSVYAHLSGVTAAVGDVVTQGQAIARVGNSGFVTGAHLHFEIRVDGSPVNPEPLIGR
jgi:hypothetical protein